MTDTFEHKEDEDGLVTPEGETPAVAPLPEVRPAPEPVDIPSPVHEVFDTTEVEPDLPGGIQRLFATIPPEELDRYSDFLTREGDKVVIQSTIDFSPPRRKLAPLIYDDTTGWFDTAGAEAQLGLVSRSVRRMFNDTQNRFGERTDINRAEVEDYLLDNADQFGAGIRRRHAEGRYNALPTKEALVRLLAYDTLMDEYEQKAAKGSAWARAIGGAADLALIEAATLGVGGVFVAGARGATRGAAGLGGTVGRTLTARFAEAAPEFSLAARARKIANRTKEGLRAADFAKETAKTIKLAKANAAIRGIKAAPVGGGTAVEALSAIGTQAAIGNMTLAQSTGKMARLLKSTSVKGAAYTGGGVFMQQAGIKLLDDDRSWGQVAVSSATAALAGFVLTAAFSGEIGKLYGFLRSQSKINAAKLKPGGKGGGGGAVKFDAGGNPIADLTVAGGGFRIPTGLEAVRILTPFIRNLPTTIGMKVERIVGRSLVGLNMPIEVAEFFAQISRTLIWGLPVYAAAEALGFVPSLLGTEGMLDKFKTTMSKDIGMRLKGEEPPGPSAAALPGSDDRGRDPADERLASQDQLKESNRLLLAELNEEVEGLLEVEPAQAKSILALITGLDFGPSQARAATPNADLEAVRLREEADDPGRNLANEMLFAGVDSLKDYSEEQALKDITTFFAALEQAQADDETVQAWNELVAETALVFHANEFADEILLSARDIESLDGSPDEFRKWAQAYRDHTTEPVSGDTIGEMLEALSYRVVEDHELTEEQAFVDLRFANSIGHIDQTNLLGSQDEQGIEAAGNMSVRVIAHSLAKLLDAKADGTLADVAASLDSDPLAWMRDAAAPTLLAFAQRMTRDQIYNIQWIGDYLATGSQEAFAYTTLLAGRTEGAKMRIAVGEMTEEDEDVATAMQVINMANFFKSYGEALASNIARNPERKAMTRTEQAQRVSEIVVANPDEEEGFFSLVWGDFVASLPFTKNRPSVGARAAFPQQPPDIEGPFFLNVERPLLAKEEPTDAPEFTEELADTPTDFPDFRP